MDELLRHYQELNLGLNDGATGEEVRALEASIGVALPSDLVMLYQHHNGETRPTRLPLRFMSVAEVREWLVMMRIYDLETDDFGWIDHGVIAFWSDDNSNYAGVYVRGPLNGRVCFLNHEDSTDIAPSYRSVSSFLAANLSGIRQGSNELDWREMGTDYPVCRPAESAKAKNAIEQDAIVARSIQRLLEDTPKSTDHEQWERTHYAFCIMALLPFEDTATLFGFARDEDMFIQGRACEILGCRRVKEAVPLLADIASHGSQNGQISAIKALGEIGTEECLKHLIHLVDTLPIGWEVHLAYALEGCGCEKTCKGSTWYYRLPNTGQWVEILLERER